MKIVRLHSGYWGINPPSKTPPPSFLQNPPLNQQTVQAPPPPILGNPPYILVFQDPPPPTLKVRSFSEPQKY